VAQVPPAARQPASRLRREHLLSIYRASIAAPSAPQSRIDAAAFPAVAPDRGGVASAATRKLIVLLLILLLCRLKPVLLLLLFSFAALGLGGNRILRI
jgi:hypothetical protein